MILLQQKNRRFGLTGSRVLAIGVLDNPNATLVAITLLCMSDLNSSITPESDTPVAPVHHEPPSMAFGDFMAGGWAPDSQELPGHEAQAAFTALRRTLLGKAFPELTLVVPTGGLKVRSNDTDYPFRPGSDFFWLTGCHEPDAVVVLQSSSEGHQATLFLAGRSDRSTPAFYRDAHYGELWVGPRRGIAETAAALDIACRDIHELSDFLKALDPKSTAVLRGFDERVDKAIEPSEDHDRELAQTLSELRMIKDDFEIARLEEAVAATVTGFEECVRELLTAQKLPNGERWLEGTFDRRARTNGNDVGYGSIVACGHHATYLHWTRNDGAVRDGDLLLMDMGVEATSLYTADVTRTIPVNGRFTDAQRRVYEVVAEAQRAGIDAVKPGASFLDPHRAAMCVIAEALYEWGILPCSVEQTLAEDPTAPNAGLHRRYTLHGTSHMLGLDVHDCANARNEFYRSGTLVTGMALTVEPGLYFQKDDLTVPAELRGIGIRIEDDVVVTEDGCRNLSAALPRRANEIEEWMAAITQR